MDNLSNKKKENKSNLVVNPPKKTLEFIDSILSQQNEVSRYKNLRFTINKGVFPFERSSRVLADYLSQGVTGNILDMGTGSGIQAIIACKNGANNVLAVDIDPKAIENTEKNICELNLEDHINVLRSNLFESVPNQKFDIIIANLPFVNCNYDCQISHLLFDPCYELHERFFNQAREYLSPNGKIVLVDGDIGDKKKLDSLIKKYNFNISKETTVSFDELNWNIYEISRRRE